MADPAVVTRDRRARGAQGDRARAEAGQHRRLSHGLGNLGAMPVVVVTDSTACLPARVVAERGIVVVPLQVVIGATVYDEVLAEGATDGATRPWSPRRSGVPAGQHVAADARAPCSRSTSGPPPRGPTEIVSVHLSGEMSGTFESAQLAARDAPVPVHPVDSRQVGVATGYAALSRRRRRSTPAGRRSRRPRRPARGPTRATVAVLRRHAGVPAPGRPDRRRRGAPRRRAGGQAAAADRRRPGRQPGAGAHVGTGAEPAGGAGRGGGGRRAGRRLRRAPGQPRPRRAAGRAAGRRAGRQPRRPRGLVRRARRRARRPRRPRHGRRLRRPAAADRPRSSTGRAAEPLSTGAGAGAEVGLPSVAGMAQTSGRGRRATRRPWPGGSSCWERSWRVGPADRAGPGRRRVDAHPGPARPRSRARPPGPARGRAGAGPAPPRRWSG